MSQDTTPAARAEPRVTPPAEPSAAFPIISVPTYLAQGRILVAFEVIGNCMAPEVADGDFIAVDLSTPEPINGDLVAVVSNRGQLMLKRFLRCGSVPHLVDNKGRDYSTLGSRLLGTVVHVERRAHESEGN